MVDAAVAAEQILNQNVLYSYEFVWLIHSYIHMKAPINRDQLC